MSNIFQQFKNCILANGIEEEEFNNSLHCFNAEIKSYKKGQKVLIAGEILDKFGVVLEGKLRVFQYDNLGNDNFFSIIYPSFIFAEAYAATKEIPPMDVVAIEDSKVIFFDINVLANPCSKKCPFHVKFGNNFFYAMCYKNVQLTQKIECMSQRTIKQKLITFLTQEYSRKNKKEFEIQYNRQELADYLGVERSALSYVISQLRNEKVIECTKNRFKLL